MTTPQPLKRRQSAPDADSFCYFSLSWSFPAARCFCSGVAASASGTAGSGNNATRLAGGNARMARTSEQAAGGRHSRVHLVFVGIGGQNEVRSWQRSRFSPLLAACLPLLV